MFLAPPCSVHPLPVSLLLTLSLSLLSLVASLSLYLQPRSHMSRRTHNANPPQSPPPAAGPAAAAAPLPEDVSAIKGLSNTESIVGVVPSPHPNTPFNEFNAIIDKQHARAPHYNNVLLFDFQALGQGGGVAPSLYERAKSLKYLDFGGVLQGRTFTSHMTRDTGQEG